MIRERVHSALPLLSASQISLFRECQRKWAWRYIAKVESPPHPSALLGTEVHDTQLGPYLNEGRPFDFTRDSGYIAAALLEFLPPPKTPGMEVEKHFILPSPASEGRFAYQGYIDLWLPGPVVKDFKTTGDLKWAKNEKAIGVDVQAMLYATHALFETKADYVELEWLYAQTRGARKSKRTYLRVHSNHVVEQFKAIEATAVELFDIKQSVTDPLSLPPSPNQCEAYGGCPYRDKCNLSPLQHLEALSAHETRLLPMKDQPMSDATSSLMANLKARKAGAQVGSPTLVSSDQEPVTLAPPPSASPEPLGINPPEKDLPPPEPAKRGPGRPKKVKAEVIEAVIEEPTAPKQLELPFELACAPFGAGAGSHRPTYLNINVQINGMKVDISTTLLEAETVPQALVRLGIS